MNSREKGKRGERQWRDQLRENGYSARRGQQFSGSPDSPDVVCPALPFHFEVKAVERLNIEDAMDQARRDASQMQRQGGKVPVVVHKRNFGPWMVTMLAEDWFKVVRGDFSGTAEPVPQLRVEGLRVESAEQGAEKPKDQCTSPCPLPSAERGQEFPEVAAAAEGQ